MVMREAIHVAAAGVLVGLGVAALATRLIAGWLFDVSPLDLVTFAGMSALFTAVALLASYLPARRAASANPLVALRAE
jgi:ABC-type antimicrobial peptide transport system permease subunit